MGPPGRPWVTLVMITTIDGAIAIDGVSGGLGAPSDAKRFIAARRQADGIIVGASTVHDEDYRPTASPIAVVTGTLSLDPAARLFGDPDRKPLLYTTAQAAEQRGEQFIGISEVLPLGDSIEPAQVLDDLHRRGMQSVVLEGGPTLNGHFLRADLVDELLISFSPLLVGGQNPGVLTGPLDEAMRFSIDRILTAEDMVFVRYLRTRTD